MKMIAILLTVTAFLTSVLSSAESAPDLPTIQAEIAARRDAATGPVPEVFAEYLSNSAPGNDLGG